jgi:hypothetical protein
VQVPEFKLQYCTKKLKIALEKSVLQKVAGTRHNTCNPSYSGGRDQEDGGSKPARANSTASSYLKKPFTKIGLVVHSEGPEFKPQYRKKKKKKKK